MRPQRYALHQWQSNSCYFDCKLEMWHQLIHRQQPLFINTQASHPQDIILRLLMRTYQTRYGQGPQWPGLHTQAWQRDLERVRTALRTNGNATLTATSPGPIVALYNTMASLSPSGSSGMAALLGYTSQAQNTGCMGGCASTSTTWSACQLIVPDANNNLQDRLNDELMSKQTTQHCAECYTALHAACREIRRPVSDEQLREALVRVGRIQQTNSRVTHVGTFLAFEFSPSPHPESKLVPWTLPLFLTQLGKKYRLAAVFNMSTGRNHYKCVGVAANGTGIYTIDAMSHNGEALFLHDATDQCISKFMTKHTASDNLVGALYELQV
jgi:hypothetical protein